MVYILGIACYYHDASATLIRDGHVVAAAEEERFTRKKHDNSFPLHAITYCLQHEKITVKDLSFIGFYEKTVQKFERVLSQHLQTFPRSWKTFLTSMPSWISEKLSIKKTLRKQLGYTGEVLFVDHHFAHAASSFLVSPFKQAAILTIDGVGEWTTTAMGIGKGTEITLTHRLQFPHSLGLLYSTLTAYLGFSVNNSEYKVMGLAAYGDLHPQTNRFYPKLRSLLDLKPDGSFVLDMQYFSYPYKDRMFSAPFEVLLEGPVLTKNSTLTKREHDIAAALQMVTEDVLTTILKQLYRQTKQSQLVLAGGVALNSVYNGKILSLTPFKRLWIQPNASDGGTSMGVASYLYHTALHRKRNYTLTSASLGPGYDSSQIETWLHSQKISYRLLTSELELVQTTAQLIYENQVVGWFQGRMEWGPRALGNRSILANPCNAQAKELLNDKVKHRENFRPFAPVVCAKDAATYFEVDEPLPDPTDFMLMVYPVRKKWRNRLPSITHVDGSGRLQTIKRPQNPRYYGVIQAFGERSGIPILINTSFNIRGEPIVCSPQDAYRCMMGTGIDYLVMENCLIKRSDNPQDMWDSEVLAVD